MKRLLLLFLLSGCSFKQADPVKLDLPANLQREMPVTAHNPLSREGIALGKKLFYDPSLSANGQVSCATCHQPELAFSEGSALSSRGVSARRLLRHVPTLTNVAFYDRYFWEGGAANLESMVFGPLRHADEMGADLGALPEQLAADDAYPDMFARAFGTDSIHVVYVARALAQYMRTLVSADSRYDRYIRQEGGQLTPLERQGMRLLQQKCGSCHRFEPGRADFFTDFSYHNNGLDSIYPDGHENIYKGRFRITYDSADMGAYKTPSLRNLALTAPYMHDGRFATLEQVMEHYRDGLKATPYLDSALYQNTGKPGIPISVAEEKAMIAFLESLTSETRAQR
jgi:cytochrome c peroxidase